MTRTDSHDPAQPLHLMLDLETLNNKPDSLIVEIGVVAFNPRTRQVVSEFQVYVNDPHSRGSVSADTVMWWLGQSQEARDALVSGFKQGATEEAAAYKLRHWVHELQPDPKLVRVWGNGASFDLPVLESLLTRVGTGTPWRYSGHRCFRTLKALAGDPEVPRSGDHIGLADAQYQVEKTFACMNVLGLVDLP